MPALPHDPDEEILAGDVIRDPWDDPEQADWPDNPTEGGDRDDVEASAVSF